MSYSIKNLFVAASAVVVLGQSAWGVDITVFDKVTKYRSNSGSKEWWGDNSSAAGVQHPDARGIAEDNETEPGTAIGQEWDLEAFRLAGSTLSMIGGYNFMAGEGTYASGDIFIDVDGDATWGVDIGGGGTKIKSNSLFGFDYVIDLQQTVNGAFDSTTTAIGNKYTVYKLDSTSDQVISVAVAANAESNPWIYHSGGEAVTGHVDRDINAGLYTGGEYLGWGGNDTHHMLQFDLSFLGAFVPDGTLFKFAMECGNDNLVGIYRNVPDQGTTLALLGGGLALLGYVRNRNRKTEAC
ncbi:MAG: VPDSG-CTERM sorting domain-containing protein [Limisphaerales bacterium]